MTIEPGPVTAERALWHRERRDVEPQLAFIRHEGRFAFQNIDELVLLAVPVQEGRLAARRYPGQIHAEIFEAEQITKRALFALRHARENIPAP